jgi:hypothetical protein
MVVACGNRKLKVQRLTCHIAMTLGYSMSIFPMDFYLLFNDQVDWEACRNYKDLYVT